MNFYKNSISLIILLVVSISNFAQEQLRHLSGNINLPAIKYNASAASKTTSVSSVYMPFFDDFSYAYKTPYPSAKNWMDSSAYVNTGFAIAPITLGVATFDGLNKLGYPYDIGATANVSAPADFLKSVPIHLDSIVTSTPGVYKKYSPVDSINLTFYYQAEGFGEAPEANDSLCVDFYKPAQNKWVKVWGKPGYNPSASDTNFYRVSVPVLDTAYFHDGFQFRFRNKATSSGSLDHWHIDYVQLKDAYFYDDTLLNDAAFAYMPSSFLKNYSVMPYHQYNEATELGVGFTNYLRNNFSIAKQAVYEYTIKDKSAFPVATNAAITIPFPGFLPFAGNGYYSGSSGGAGRPLFSASLPPFPTPPFTDSTFFTIQHTLTTSSDVNNSNDTLEHVQRFTNYYAYDDGTAELGYYLNTYGAKIALRFGLNVSDTLKGVRIYFDPIIEGSLVKTSPFRIVVWANGGNGPGGIIYKDSVMYPQYLSGNHNMMPTYNLTSCLPLGAGTYYIGIIQQLNQELNIGFDRNTNHKNALYFNTSGTWNQSVFNGSLMLNPVMGCVDPPIIIGLNNYDKLDKIKIFPNPAQSSITVSFPGNQLTASSIEITNMLGQTVFTKQITSNEQVDINDLSNGVYFIHLKGNSLNVSSQKLIISK